MAPKCARPAVRPFGRGRAQTASARENRAGLGFVTPTFVVVLVVVILPILWTVLLAFQHAELRIFKGRVRGDGQCLEAVYSALINCSADE